MDTHATEAATTSYVAVIYSPGPAWQEGRTAMEQGIKEHIDYQHRLHSQGQVAMGGPWLDRHGGMALFSVDSIEEAKALTDADPVVRRGVYSVEHFHWQVPLGGS